ncbi:MAG: hypothetical protein OER90_21135 [Gemmatimonadota bacterium]|nr:hypothetical protein [Gemmatimonadota bacterium]
MLPQQHLSRWSWRALGAACSVGCAGAVIACGDASSLAVWDGVVRDSAGIEIIENFGTPLWREGEPWTFTEVLRIGVVEGDSLYEFGRITGMAVLSDRRVVVADAMSHNLRFFSVDGVCEQTVGMQGRGPGEFGDGFLGLLHGPGDTLLVRDVANGQMHTIAPDGTILGSFSTSADEGYYSAGWDDDVATGRLVSSLVPLQLPNQPPTDTFDIVLARDVHGAVLDTVARVPTSARFSSAGEATLRHYYRGSPDFDLCGEGIVSGRSDDYRLLWSGPGGNVSRIITMPWEPLSMTDADHSIIEDRIDEMLQQYQVPLARANEFKATLRFESTYPAYRRLVCGPSTTVLVQHVRPVRDLTKDERKDLPTYMTGLPGTVEWDVFDRTGRYLGIAAIPGTDWVAGWRNPRFVRDHTSGTWYAYSVWSDTLDVEYVVAWQLEGNMPE